MNKPGGSDQSGEEPDFHLHCLRCHASFDMSSECLPSVFPWCVPEVVSLVLGWLIPEIAMIFVCGVGEGGNRGYQESGSGWGMMSL